MSAASPRVALVTGTAAGLGAVLAAGLHGAGYRVALADLDESGAVAVAADLDRAGETAIALRLDVREKPKWYRALADVLSRWGAAHWSTTRP